MVFHFHSDPDVICCGTLFFVKQINKITNTYRAGLLKNIEVVVAVVAAANSSLMLVEKFWTLFTCSFWVLSPLLDRCCCCAAHRQVHRSLSPTPQKEIIWIQRVNPVPSSSLSSSSFSIAGAVQALVLFIGV